MCTAAKEARPAPVELWLAALHPADPILPGLSYDEKRSPTAAAAYGDGIATIAASAPRRYQ